MAVSVETKVRVGFSLASIMCLAMAGSAALTYNHFLETRGTVLCGSLAALSFFVWLAGLLTSSERRGSAKQNSEHPLACIAKPRYLGLILMAAAALTYAYTSYNRQHKLKPPMPARIVAQPPQPVSFPPLKVQSIIWSGPNSTALINGEVLRVGEGIGDVRLAEIHSNSVEVELQGERKSIALSQ